LLLLLIAWQLTGFTIVLFAEMWPKLYLGSKKKNHCSIPRTSAQTSHPFKLCNGSTRELSGISPPCRRRLSAVINFLFGHSGSVVL